MEIKLIIIKQGNNNKSLKKFQCLLMMKERDNKGRFIKKGSEKAEKKPKKGGRRRDTNMRC